MVVVYAGNSPLETARSVKARGGAASVVLDGGKPVT
jgi:hypothetical protein